MLAYNIIGYGGAMVSTGIRKHCKRIEAHDRFKTCTLNLNANNNKLAYAA